MTVLTHSASASRVSRTALLIAGEFVSSDLERAVSSMLPAPASCGGPSGGPRILAGGQRGRLLHQPALSAAGETSGIASA